MYFFCKRCHNVFVVIDLDMSALGKCIEVVDDINTTGKMFIFQLMNTVKLPGAKIYDTQMVMLSVTFTKDISLA